LPWAPFGINTPLTKGKAFCERPFALHRQQPEKNTQNVAVSHPWKNLCGCPIAHASDDPRPHLKTDPRV